MNDLEYASKIEKYLRTVIAGTCGAVLFTCIACNGTQVIESPATAPPPDVALGSLQEGAEDSPSESWRCRNDLEVSCAEGACEVAPVGGFTPMDVNFDDSGAMSVCAYSGCWQGTGEVVRSGDFLVLIGQELEFSTAQRSDSGNANVVIAVDRADKVATLKAEAFALPLLCERSSSAAQSMATKGMNGP